MDIKRKFTVLAACLVIAIVAGTLLIVYNEPSPSMVAYTAQAQKIFKDARIAWVQIRNGTLPNVQLVVVTKQWAINTWGKDYAQQNLASIMIEQNTYQGLFMIPENRSLYQAEVSWPGDFVAATWEGKIYVEVQNFNPWDLPSSEATLVHELTHMWQPSLPSPTTFDQDKAQDALIEGDATFMADTYTNLTDSGALQTAESTSTSFPTDIISVGNAVRPDTLSNIDYFPYTDGEAFVEVLYQHGGFTTVDRAYKAGYVPSTTAQIMNPQLYYQNVTAQPVDLPTPVGGWNQTKTSYGLYYNAYGEYFILDMLSNWLPQSQAQSLSNGWEGDNFTYYQNGDNSSSYLFTWNIQWNSSSTASSFITAFQAMAQDAQATSIGTYQWLSNGRYLSISFGANANQTLIACSTEESAIQPSAFT